jgi:hypothetical protein
MCSFFNFSIYNQNKSYQNTEEMEHFYLQLKKMKKNRKSFDIKQVILKVYPKFIFPKDE